MWRSLIILLLLLALWLPLPSASAQNPGVINPNLPAEERSPALPFAIATIFSMIILTVVCMPTRKG